MFSPEYAQLLTEGKDLQAETVTGTEKGGEEGESADEECVLAAEMCDAIFALDGARTVSVH